MVAPLVVAGATLAAGGLAGSIFGKKKAPNYDIARINQLINAGGAEQRDIIGKLRPETRKLTDQFQTGVEGSLDRAATERRAAGDQYMKDLDPITSRIYRNSADQLKRDTFGAIPEATQAVREALASSGGLNRGVALESLAKVPLQQAQEYTRGISDLTNTALQAKQTAVRDLYSAESQATAEKLGISRDMYSTIMNSNNDALKGELAALIDESQNRISGLVAAEQFRQSGNAASVAAENANRDAIFSGLTNLGGTLMGAGLPVGVSQVPTAQRTRATPQSANEQLQELILRRKGALR